MRLPPRLLLADPFWQRSPLTSIFGIPYFHGTFVKLALYLPLP